MISIEKELNRSDLDCSSPKSFVVSLAKSLSGGVLYAVEFTKLGLENHGMTKEQPWALMHCRNKNEGFEIVEKDRTVDHFYILYEEDFGPIEGEIDYIIKPIYDKLGIVEKSPVSGKKMWQFWK